MKKLIWIALLLSGCVQATGTATVQDNGLIVVDPTVGVGLNTGTSTTTTIGPLSLTLQ